MPTARPTKQSKDFCKRNAPRIALERKLPSEACVRVRKMIALCHKGGAQSLQKVLEMADLG